MNQHQGVERFWIIPENESSNAPLTQQQQAEYEKMLRSVARHGQPRVDLSDSESTLVIAATK